jgi:hypothetical protein
VLNELLIIERGAPQEQVTQNCRHADVQDARRNVPTLHIWLDSDGRIASALPVPKNCALWTMRKGNEISFPFIQVKKPLLKEAVAKSWDRWKKNHPRPKVNESREEMLQLAKEHGELRQGNLGKWATQSVMIALRQRLRQVGALRETAAAVLPAALERFLRACDRDAGGDVQNILKDIHDRLLESLQAAASDAWVACSVAILAEGKGAIYLDAEGNWPYALTDSRIITPISDVLDRAQRHCDTADGTCALTGNLCSLVADTFPNPNLRVIGPTILFSRYDGRPANDRYGRFGSESMPVGATVARRLAAAARVLTAHEREGKTWRQIPGERSKQTDLLIAFVERAPDAPVADAIAGDDYSEETAHSATEDVSGVAEFEKRTERLIEAIRAKVGADFRETPVQLAIFRKVDNANRKIVYSGAPTVGQVYDAALAWTSGEHNLPDWVTLPAPRNKDRKVRPTRPPHVPPLAMIGLCKQWFLRSGKRPPGKKKEQVGLAVGDALGLFLADDPRRVRRVLRLILNRRAGLLNNVAHARRVPMRRTARKQRANSLDEREALRTVTVLGILLYKLGRGTENYMNDSAFKLGQLLAAADAVHAGYCADVRGGAVPPSLLGNQMFAIAQTAPVKALAMLSRRWKPYNGWATKVACQRRRADTLIASKRQEDQQRGWAVKIAIRHVREMKKLCAELAEAIAGVVANDTFRAELLLGYVAGIPKAEKEESDDYFQTTVHNGKEG